MSSITFIIITRWNIICDLIGHLYSTPYGEKHSLRVVGRLKSHR